ncbi:MAG TPA: hypothetical protein VGQ91_06470 [Ideonella sp.]|jgi:hypothetical protein|nr:hypothetical protein [Ideonella sp.]
MPTTYYLGYRSLFVTLTAWAAIMLAAIACAFGAIQQASLASWAPGLDAAVQSEPVPMISGVMLSYLPWVVGAGLMISVALLVAAVGLLMRLEWARRAFIGLVVVAIVANLASLWLQHQFVQSLVDATLRDAALPLGALGVFGGFATAAKVLSGVLTLFACGLLGWVIRRLMSPKVRQEFVA